jgi:putative transposase
MLRINIQKSSVGCKNWQRKRARILAIQQREAKVKACAKRWRLRLLGKEEVNKPQTEAEVQALRRSVQRGQPYGDAAWTKRVAARMRLESTLRPRGRPPKQPKDSQKGS